MFKKWICLTMGAILLLAQLTGCKPADLPKETEKKEETLDHSAGVGNNQFSDSDFLDSSQGEGNTQNQNPDSSQGESDNDSQNTDPDPEQNVELPPQQDPDTDSEEEEITEYEWYENLSPDEQMAHYATFASMADFVAWYNAAKEEYEALHPPIEAGDGEIDLGSISGQ